MLRLKVLKQLNGRRREEVRELEKLCCEHDHIQGGVLLAGTEEDGEKPTFFLCYEEELLAGFAVFYRMPDGTAEVCGYIHPEHRRRVMIKKMLTALRKEAESVHAAEMYYVNEPHPDEAMGGLVGEGDCEYVCSEYLMEWKYSYLLQKTNA
ncbi:MAG: GNAT family N-acetyltransferase, partial [Lachnospiraceae bacterium]|nr:GNAT family N-acetyltransferase [Lachnospiraceae bacterium]